MNDLSRIYRAQVVSKMAINLLSLIHFFELIPTLFATAKRGRFPTYIDSSSKWNTSKYRFKRVTVNEFVDMEGGRGFPSKTRS